MSDKPFVVKISMDLIVDTEHSASATRVANEKVLIPLANHPIGRKFEIESVKEKEEDGN